MFANLPDRHGPQVRLTMLEDIWRISHTVMAGLVPAIHVLLYFLNGGRFRLHDVEQA
jgi:hypothetical protein